MNFGQYERTNRGDGELRGADMSDSHSQMSSDKGQAYDADDVALEERGVGAIHAHSDARRVW